MRIHCLLVYLCSIVVLTAQASVGQCQSTDIASPQPAAAEPVTQAASPGKTPGGFTISGDAAELAVNASAGTSPLLLFKENGTTMFSLLADSVTMGMFGL